MAKTAEVNTDLAYELVGEALQSALIGGFESFDSEDGIVLIGPLTGGTRKVFLLTLTEAKVRIG